MIPDPAPPFEVGMSVALQEHIGNLLRRAAGQGMGVAFRETFRIIMNDLRVRPRFAGDPLRSRHGFSATEYRILRKDLIVNYTVHNRIPMVTVWRFDLAPSHPLNSSPPNDNGSS